MDIKYVHIFDCDGVILDSNNFKIESLKKSLNKEDFSNSDIEKILSFFKSNFGLTRDSHFIKFREIINQNESHHDNKFRKLRTSYDLTVLRDYPKCSLIEENVEHIKKLVEKNDIYIVSASDQVELRSFLPEKFKSVKEKNILGGPTKKSQNLKALKNKLGNKLVYYGDSVNDARAAIDNNIKFIGLSKYSNTRNKLIEFCAEKNLIVRETL
tara:strand:+ start:1596 stop:2231 length:636 start_codon:yes stop_codon:yes gene_type:complete